MLLIWRAYSTCQIQICIYSETGLIFSEKVCLISEYSEIAWIQFHLWRDISNDSWNNNTYDKMIYERQ